MKTFYLFRTSSNPRYPLSIFSVHLLIPSHESQLKVYFLLCGFLTNISDFLNPHWHLLYRHRYPVESAANCPEGKIPQLSRESKIRQGCHSHLPMYKGLSRRGNAHCYLRASQGVPTRNYAPPLRLLWSVIMRGGTRTGMTSESSERKRRNERRERERERYCPSHVELLLYGETSELDRSLNCNSH